MKLVSYYVSTKLAAGIVENQRGLTSLWKDSLTSKMRYLLSVLTLSIPRATVSVNLKPNSRNDFLVIFADSPSLF